MPDGRMPSGWLIARAREVHLHGPPTTNPFHGASQKHMPFNGSQQQVPFPWPATANAFSKVW